MESASNVHISLASAKEMAAQIIDMPGRADRLSKRLAEEVLGSMDPVELLRLPIAERAQFCETLELGVLACDVAIGYKLAHARPGADEPAKERQMQFLTDLGWQQLYMGKADSATEELFIRAETYAGGRRIDEKNLLYLDIAARVGRSMIRIGRGETKQDVVGPIAEQYIDETEYIFRSPLKTEGRMYTAAAMAYMMMRTVKWYLGNTDLVSIRPALMRERGDKKGSFELVEHRKDGLLYPMYIRDSKRWFKPEIEVLYPRQECLDTPAMLSSIATFREMLQSSVAPNVKQEWMADLEEWMGYRHKKRSRK